MLGAVRRGIYTGGGLADVDLTNWAGVAGRGGGGAAVGGEEIE